MYSEKLIDKVECWAKRNLSRICINLKFNTFFYNKQVRIPLVLHNCHYI